MALAPATAPPASRCFLLLPARPRALNLKLSRTGSLLLARSAKSDLQLSSKHDPRKNASAVYLLLLSTLGVFAADHLLQVEGVKQLYLYHGAPKWYQFVTATFCHGNWNHLSSNLFFIYIFGKLVEEDEGGLAMWLCYIITGAGANLLSWLVLPTNVVSVGASGAVFGLFAISVLVKLSWDWRKLLEVLILGQFVVDKVIDATRMVHVQNSNVNHIAHCGGALIGALLIWMVTRIPRSSSGAK